MMTIAATWCVFFIALHRTIEILMEAHQDHRNVLLLCSENTALGKIVHPKWTQFGVSVTSFAWAAFGFLLMI